MTEDPLITLEDPQAAVHSSKLKSSRIYKWWKKVRFSGKAVDNGLKTTLSILLRGIFIVLILLGLVFIFNELSDSNYSIEEMSVPQSFHERGYTGHVLANRIFNRINSIIKNERLADVAKEYSNANAIVDLNVEVVGIGVPIRSLTSILGETLGLNNRKTITGNLSVDGDTLILELTINGYAEKFHTAFTGSTEASMSSIVASASEAILKHSNPYVLARYYLMRDSEGCFALGRFILNKHQDNPDIEPIGYFAVAGGYLTQGEFATAEGVARLGVEKYPDDLNLQAALSTMLHRSKKYNEAIAQCKKIISMLDSNTPINRVARSYLNLAYIMEDLNKSDSAIFYANIVLNRDKDFVEARAFIGRQYYSRGDTTLALTHWATAFEKGMRVVDFTRMMTQKAPQIINDPKVKDLMRQHRDEY
jgi:tetratricopeptide (TPR) repeat protein